MEPSSIITIIISIGLPSAIIGFGLRRVEKKMDQRKDEQEEKEECRQDFNLLMIKGITASMALSEASAMALKNGKTNGETTEALKYSKDVKNELKDFIYKHGVKEVV